MERKGKNEKEEMEESIMSGWKVKEMDESLLPDFTKEQIITSETLTKNIIEKDATTEGKVPLKKKKSFKRVLKINTTRCRGELKLVRKIIKDNDWKEVTNEDGDIMWSGLALVGENMSAALDVWVNRLPGMTDLAHKKTTGYFLNKFREYFPSEFKFYPRTFLLPEQLNEFEKYFKKKSKIQKVFIAKPTAGCQGDGIVLIRNLKDLPLNKYSSSNEMVVQRYLDKPLLLGGKKFDLRLYVLISSIDPLICYLNEEGLARFATVDYEPVTQSNLRNYYMHLTNYSLNKLSPTYTYSEELHEPHNGSKRTLESLWKSLMAEGHNVELIKERIEDLIKRFMTSMLPYLIYNYKTTFNGKKGKCFHVVGFDVILTDKLKPFLLEINANPSLNPDFEFEGPDGKKVTQISPIDMYVKQLAVEDACKIVSTPVQEQVNGGVGEWVGSYKRLMNGSEVLFSDMKLFNRMVDVYGTLCGFKFRGAITAGKFVKLAGIPGMTNEKITKNSYDIVFKKIIRNSGNTSQMDFYSFIDSIENLAKDLAPSWDASNKLPSVSYVVDLIHSHQTSL